MAGRWSTQVAFFIAALVRDECSCAICCLPSLSVCNAAGEWMAAKATAHPLFDRVSDEELASDPAAGEPCSLIACGSQYNVICILGLSRARSSSA